MKKTVNINLAGTFFHIDEDAYAKLQRYLAAIKKSFTDPQGSDEIMRDIETRISELFSEKVEHTSQVISIKELDEVIAVMGQPEDYMVGEELFDDEPIHTSRSKRSSTGHKQLFRDIDNKFISGVSSGLSHYIGLDALWIRLIWILLTVFSSGTFIIVYILFWVLVPAAESTADKLKMTGEAVNISNIEKKFKEGYENVADKVKNADYDKYGQKVKKGTSGFFSSLGNILLVLLKIFVKFIGIILIITSLATLVSLIIGLFTFGSVDFWGNGEVMDYISTFAEGVLPIWLVSLTVFFAVGIPFFVLFILGLKLLIPNLKSIGTPAKIILFIVWIVSLVSLGIFGVSMANQQAFDGDAITENVLPIKTGDTLKIKMQGDNQYSNYLRRRGGLRFKYNENNEKVIYSNDVRLIVKSTNDSIARLIVDRRAEGASFLEARERAEAISYNYTIENNTLTLDGYHISPIINKYRDQEVELTLFMPVGSILYADDNTYSFHSNSDWYGDILHNGDEEQYLEIQEDKTVCLDCPEEENEDEDLKWDSWEERKNTNRTNNNWEAEVEEELEGLKEDIKTLKEDATKTIEEIETDSLTINN